MSTNYIFKGGNLMSEERYRRNTYPRKRRVKKSSFSIFGAGVFVLLSTVCIAIAVMIILDLSFPTGGIFFEGEAVPVFADDSDSPTLVSTALQTDNHEEESSNSSIHPPDNFGFYLLPFYILENLEAYINFANDRPDLSVEEVVWKVNVGIHVPLYSLIITNYDENPLLVSPVFRLPYGFSPPNLVPINNDNDALLATPEAVAAFRELRSASIRAGFPNGISATSGYRTAARQRANWERNGSRDGEVARPYHSEHQTGRAIDLWGPGGLMDQSGPSPIGTWVAENAHEFGFIMRYLAETTHITGYIHEPWHITYVGLEISMYMFENNILSLEEFVGRNPGAKLP